MYRIDRFLTASKKQWKNLSLFSTKNRQCIPAEMRCRSVRKSVRNPQKTGMTEKNKKPRNPLVSRLFAGGDKRDRTADLLNAIQALSQLSYTPICRNECYYSELFPTCQALSSKKCCFSQLFFDFLRLFLPTAANGIVNAVGQKATKSPKSNAQNDRRQHIRRIMHEEVQA